MDEQLRRAGAALAEQVDPSGVFERVSERAASSGGAKGHVRVAVLAVVVVGAVAAGSFGLARIFFSSGETPGHRPGPPSTVIPWTAATPSPSPRPTPTPPPSAPLCTGSMLKVRASSFQGATGSAAGGIIFTNTTTSSCSLQGTLRVEILDRAGHVLPVSQYQGRPAPRVDLAPGHSAVVTVQWFNWCAPWPSNGRFNFRITLPGGRGQFLAPFTSLQPRCDTSANASTMGIGSFQSTDVPTGLPPQPPALSAKLHLPGSVRAGTTLHYEVTLTNTSSTPFAFGRCPSYREEIGPAGGDGGWAAQDEYILNCGPAGILSPGASATFAMQIATPADAAPGSAGLFWLLEPGFATLPGAPAPDSGPGVKGSLLVTAR